MGVTKNKIILYQISQSIVSKTILMQGKNHFLWHKFGNKILGTFDMLENMGVTINKIILYQIRPSVLRKTILMQGKKSHSLA
jgi:hypothetical protein